MEIPLPEVLADKVVWAVLLLQEPVEAEAAAREEAHLAEPVRACGRNSHF